MLYCRFVILPSWKWVLHKHILGCKSMQLCNLPLWSSSTGRRRLVCSTFDWNQPYVPRDWISQSPQLFLLVRFFVGSVELSLGLVQLKGWPMKFCISLQLCLPIRFYRSFLAPLLASQFVCKPYSMWWVTCCVREKKKNYLGRWIRLRWLFYVVFAAVREC